jgi:hypothetical protein
MRLAAQFHVNGLTGVCSRRHGAVTPSAEKGTRRAGAGRG